ncbi:hypothetical protein D8I24_4696 [Cupriavidus necator H850]|nr:hypothetical protein D8I24_4696 [Cupriavidus necator H850]
MGGRHGGGGWGHLWVVSGISDGGRSIVHSDHCVAYVICHRMTDNPV